MPKDVFHSQLPELNKFRNVNFSGELSSTQNHCPLPKMTSSLASKKKYKKADLIKKNYETDNAEDLNYALTTVQYVGSIFSNLGLLAGLMNGSHNLSKTEHKLRANPSEM